MTEMRIIFIPTAYIFRLCVNSYLLSYVYNIFFMHKTHTLLYGSQNEKMSFGWLLEFHSRHHSRISEKERAPTTLENKVLLYY